MYLTQPIGNILQKFNNQTINIYYEPYHNMIDIMLGLCDLNFYSFEKDLVDKNIGTNLGLSFCRPNQIDLFHYNMAISNNILSYASNQKFLSAHLNTIIFVSNNRPSQLKKEDLLLMDNNLSKVIKVFFDKQQAESWKFKDYKLVNYGISLDHFYITNEYSNRNKKVLLLNFNGINNEGIRILSQILQNNNINFDVINELPYDTERARELFNQYSVCVELNERNISNVLVSIACGCMGLSYDANDLGQSYRAVPNLYFGKTIYDIANGVVSLLNQNTPQDCKDYLKENFDFISFKEHITNLVQNLNKGTFYL